MVRIISGTLVEVGLGKTKPEISAVLSEDGSRVDIKITHEKGIESISFNFNGTDYMVDIGDENPTEISFSQNLINEIILNTLFYFI